MANTSVEEFEIYIRKLETGAKYYIRCMVAAFWLLIIVRLVVFVAPVTASLIAAFAAGDASNWAKPWLVALPIVGAAAALLLSQLRVDEFIGLQEDYRREFSYLADQGRQRKSAGEQSHAIHADLLAKAEAFEKAYPSKLRAVVGSFFSSAKPTGRASGTAGS